VSQSNILNPWNVLHLTLNPTSSNNIVASYRTCCSSMMCCAQIQHGLCGQKPNSVSNDLPGTHIIN
jgi:hypothetical protein